MDDGKTIVFTGATKNPYIFTVYRWDTSLVSYGAVYVVLRRDRIGYSMLYVGRTGELSVHVSSHPLMEEFQRSGRTHIGVHIEPETTKRYAKQMDLIVNFNPELNKVRFDRL